MQAAIKAAIIGPGNIGTDLMYKLLKKQHIDLVLVSGIDSKSRGLKLARENGINTSLKGVEAVLADNKIEIVFDSTSARSHHHNAPLLKQAGKIAIDLTPAAVGPYVSPAVNLDAHLDVDNINLITCGGQATIPIVAAISRVCKVKYAEIVATISSDSAGPGTRQNIDEFTQTTAAGLQQVGGAETGKAIIILNPAVPPILMRDTIYARVENPNKDKIIASVLDMVSVVKQYVPGYTLKLGPLFDGDRVITMLEIEGAGDFLPTYAGNLDIMTAAAAAVGERMAIKLLENRKGLKQND